VAAEFPDQPDELFLGGKTGPVDHRPEIEIGRDNLVTNASPAHQDFQQELQSRFHPVAGVRAGIRARPDGGGVLAPHEFGLGFAEIKVQRGAGGDEVISRQSTAIGRPKGS